MSRPIVRRFSIGDLTVQTPCIVPSFSSRADRDEPMSGMMAGTLDRVISPLLVSAYDIDPSRPTNREHILRLEAARPQFLILDSGGYELLKLKDRRARKRDPWSLERYEAVISAWPRAVPLMVVSYDDPWERRMPLDDQIAAAATLGAGRKDVGRTMLLKPEPEAVLLDMDVLGPSVHKLARFEVVGVTEKEIGACMRDRLAFLLRLRAALTVSGSSAPIHVFGGLDPTMTPLYCFAGADIIDGLSWLRFGFVQGRAIYRQAYMAKTFSRLGFEEGLVHMRHHNLVEIANMQIAMQRFASSGDPSDLRKVAPEAVSDFAAIMAG